MLEKHGIRIIPLNLFHEERELRKQFSIKLAGFKTGTMACDLGHILTEMKAKSCFILRYPSTYRLLNYAYINFNNQESLDIAVKKYYELDS